MGWCLEASADLTPMKEKAKEGRSAKENLRLQHRAKKFSVWQPLSLPVKGASSRLHQDG